MKRIYPFAPIAFLSIFTLALSTPAEAVRHRNVQGPSTSWRKPLLIAAVAGASAIAYQTLSRLFQSASTPTPHNDDIDYDHSVIVHQRQYAIATCEGASPSKLSAYHINGCHFLVLYHPGKSVAMGIHWDDETKPSELPRVLEIFKGKGIKLSELEAHFVGGWRSNRYYTFSQHFGTYLYDSLVKAGLKQENINTRYMYERLTPNMPTNQFLRAGKDMDPAYFFMGVSFDACLGQLKLSDSQLPRSDQLSLPDFPGSSKQCTEYQIEVAGSGCPLKKSKHSL